MSRLAVEIAAGAADLVETLHLARDRARVAAARTRATEAAQLAASIDRGEAVEGSRSVPWTRANRALAAAEAARAAGEDAPGSWPLIAEAFAAMGMAPKVAYLEYREAGAALRTGDRVAAERALRAASQRATSIGMTALLRKIDALARAARIDLHAAAVPASTPARTHDPWGLSGREREVLSLLAEGRSNAEIGARLFISAKTASVHVTHILDKLGVSSRTEAALLASQAGILG
jgi:DNA-binding CsgD family transcriptional regulator